MNYSNYPLTNLKELLLTDEVIKSTNNTRIDIISKNFESITTITILNIQVIISINIKTR